MKKITIALAIAMLLCAVCSCAPREPEQPIQPAFNVEAELTNAERLFLEGNYEEVILTLETVLEIEPASVQGYLRLSDAYIARGEEEKALELLKRGLEQTGDEQIAARIQGMTEVIDGIMQVAANEEGVPWSGGSTLLLDAEGKTYWCGQRSLSYSFGRLSASYDEYVPIPTFVEGLPALQNISNNGGRFCGVSQSGDLYVWGYNCGSLIGDHDEDEGPIKIWEDVSKAVWSGLSILVLKNDGKLYSRGWNSDGILGTGQPFVKEFDDNGVADLGNDYCNQDEWLFVMDGVRDIKFSNISYHVDDDLIGGDVCLAITQDNQLYGWGLFGRKEQDGKIYKDAYNRPQLLMQGIRDAGITVDGKLFYVTMKGALEYVPLSDVLKNPEPVTVPIPGAAIMSVSCGRHHICALDTAGVLYVSGSNQYGQLGIGQSVETTSYEDVVQPLGNTYVRQVSAGPDHTCALLGDGRLLTWGNNQYGQLGNGRMGKQRAALEPTRVLSDVERVFATYYSTSAALSHDGTLYQAGEANENVFAPVMEDVQAYVGGSVITKDSDWKGLHSETVLAQNVVYAHVGSDNNGSIRFYVDTGGCLWGASNNYSGELGLGTRNDPLLAESKEIDSDSFALIMEGATKCVCGTLSVASGSYDINGTITIILTEDGDVLQCGANPNTGEFVLRPEKIASGMRDIAICRSTVYMIDENDDLYVWGWSSFDFIHDDNISLTNIDEPIKIYGGVQKIAIGGRNHLMLDKTGNVHTFGFKTFVEVVGKDTREWSPSLGIPQDELICKQVELPGLAKDIAAGGESYYVVLENGDLYAWGDNQQGQLGLGDAGNDENIFEVKLPE